MDEADLKIDDLNMDQFIDRLVIYIVCGANMLLCAITIYLFLKVRSDIISRINQVMQHAGIQVEDRRPLLGTPMPVLPPASTVRVTRARSPSSGLPLERIRSQGIAGPTPEGMS